MRVLGGTGVFGSSLCRLLAADPAIALTIAARDRAAVDALARELGAGRRAGSSSGSAPSTSISRRASPSRGSRW